VSRPRHVLLNATFLDPSVSGGPETYLRGLARALAGEFPDLRLTVATTRSGARALRDDGWEAWASIAELPCEDGQRLRRQVAEQALVPVLARRRGVDLVHSLASTAPIRTLTPAVITLHDVTFLVRRTFGATTTWGMREVITRAARHADALITGSAAARDEICAVLRMDPDEFVVVPHGRGRSPRPSAVAEAEVRRRFVLGDAPVILCVGAKRPHKNQEVLVRALADLPDAVLVLAGHAEPYEDELRRSSREAGVEGRVRFVGYVPDDVLEALWALCACAAFPTLGEGFGLPLVEAMDRGVAIAASDIPVLREVGGDVPFWFDPHSPAAAAHALAAAIDDADAGPRGREQAARFTWEAAAHGTMDAYERALGHAAT
jgi:glycosyltransferase involved in cell wall biosynthesis